MPSFSEDSASNFQQFTTYMQQYMAIMTSAMASQVRPITVNTLPDLSASLRTFHGSGVPSAESWLEELERTQKLVAWEDSTLLAIAQSKLRGAAADWHETQGWHMTTWHIWKASLKESFGEQLSFIQWQETSDRQITVSRRTLHSYAFAKLQVISRCPVSLTDK
ncbi:hypothetical protein HPB48_003228 [Haemaphysalis longicornis]|uniref:Retrotransposon gag domain-containing protein n=1 Tax=Haemaphysalis longicornis TaxID=44386 RepID=A0A9J6FXZ9_HAELO|nr:hypothetical protein HPB48_003228 [Haemaphysalis longicornis]